MPMYLLYGIIIGVVAGALFDLFTYGKTGSDLIVEMLLGVAGSLVGEFVVRSFGVVAFRTNLIASGIGAAVLLLIYFLLVRRR